MHYQCDEYANSLALSLPWRKSEGLCFMLRDISDARARLLIMRSGFRTDIQGVDHISYSSPKLHSILPKQSRAV